MFGTYRFLLACLVALSHFGLTVAGFHPGQWSVLSFYVLSGFLMEHQFHKLATARAFYLDRLLRIYPLFLAVLLLATWLARPSLWTFAVNASLFPLDYSFFTDIPMLIAPSWSLACEAHFYLLVPLLARASTFALRTCALGSVALFACSPFLPASTFWAYTALPGIFFAFLSGMLIRRRDRFFLGSLWILFAALLGAFLYSKLAHLGLPTGIHINVCIGYLAALPLVSWLSSFSPKVLWDRKLGLLSYPLFLVHEPAQALLSPYFHHLSTGVSLLWAVAVSGLLVLLIERPFDVIRYKMRRADRRMPVLAQETSASRV